MESAAHLHRMSCHCAAIAGRIGEEAELVGAASRLHDVGMDNIAQRPAPLTVAERDHVEGHPEAGYAMLTGSGIKSFDLAADIALSHHEHFDGGGYPKGLRGDEIPITGRIAAVADAFDALTTDRVYRSAGTVEAAVETLKGERGRQFDPAVVDAFVDGLDDALRALVLHPAPPRDGAEEEDTLLTLQGAADTLRISPSRLRRWSDEGRIETLRTRGGHRLFPLAAVRRLADEIGVQPTVRPLEPPPGPVVAVATTVRTHGAKLTAAAASSIYRNGPTGWFGAPAAFDTLADWLDALVDGCEEGQYSAVKAATDALMVQAHAHAATLLERHLFVQRFGQLTLRLVLRTEPSTEEFGQAKRLFGSIEQHLLDVTRPAGFEPATSRSGGARSIH